MLNTIGSELPRRSMHEAAANLVALFDDESLELPLLPSAAAQVMSLARDEDADARKLADVVRRDQALTAHLLRLANSPAYKPRTAIVSLQQALARLGLVQVRTIAFAISCKGRVFAVREMEAVARELFRHALATALFAQEVARTRRSNVEEAFLAGLLHDVGRTIALQALSDRKIDRDAWPSLVSMIHAPLGARLVRHWKLPEAVAIAIAEHHDPVPTTDLGHTVALADELAHRAMRRDPLEAFDHPARAALMIYADDLAAIAAKSDAVRASVETLP
jgi:putative nucleotidyltransferase with HDIG domain